MLLMISFKRLMVGVRLWNSKFVTHSILLDALAYLLLILSVARNRPLSMRRKPLFRLNISRHTPRLTGPGFQYPSHHLSPKSRSGLLSILVPRIHMDEEVLSHTSYRDFGERGFIRFSVNSPGGGARSSRLARGL